MKRNDRSNRGEKAAAVAGLGGNPDERARTSDEAKRPAGFPMDGLLLARRLNVDARKGTMYGRKLDYFFCPRKDTWTRS